MVPIGTIVWYEATPQAASLRAYRPVSKVLMMKLRAAATDAEASDQPPLEIGDGGDADDDVWTDPSFWGLGQK